MVSSASLPSRIPAPNLSAAGSITRPRSALVKSLRRLLRTARTEVRLFAARPLRRRPWTLPLLILLFLIFLFVALVTHRSKPASSEKDHSSEDIDISHHVHDVLPKQAPWESALLHPCSWLYLEFGAKDGRHLDSFFSDGSSFLEEFLRATQSSMRGFCALAFEANPAMEPVLLDVRKVRGRKAFRFNVYAGVVPGAHNGSEKVVMSPVDEAGDKEVQTVQSLALADTVRRLTFPWEKSGQEVRPMNTARGNSNFGTVVVRLNVNDIREAFWHLDLLEAAQKDGVMCKRIDRLILNLQKMTLESNANVVDIEDCDVIREWDKLVTPPHDPSYDPKKGVAGLVALAHEINNREGCRTIVHVIDETGHRLSPPVISERQVFYAILAGQPTFNERVASQTESWMTVVPQDRLTIFTNKPRNSTEMLAARNRDTVVVHPHNESLEQRLPLMQSWSHLVRVRESWDRTMKHNPEIKWLALVDDDTFVFPGGMREYLSMFDHRIKIWGGSGEQARIDNGDGGKFAHWLRELHKKHGGKHCYMPTEDVPANLRGAHVEYAISKVLNGRRVARKVSHMCGDMFCKMGCPAVPQGAAIFLSRTLVKALRPRIEECERDTAGLCRNCGSQRLYMCVNRYAAPARTLLTRGICRAPWKLEHREKFPFALTFHGFNRYHGMALSTKSLRGDMNELWQLGKGFEEGVKQGYKTSYLIPMQNVADLIGCRGKGRYHKGDCITAEGVRLESTDGKKRKPHKVVRRGKSDRNGSA